MMRINTFVNGHPVIIESLDDLREEMPDDLFQALQKLIDLKQSEWYDNGFADGVEETENDYKPLLKQLDKTINSVSALLKGGDALD